MIDLFIMINNMAAGTISQVVPMWISVSQVQSFVAIIAAQWAECLCSACNMFNFFKWRPLISKPTCSVKEMDLKRTQLIPWLQEILFLKSWSILGTLFKKGLKLRPQRCCATANESYASLFAKKLEELHVNEKIKAFYRSKFVSQAF